MAPQGPQGRKKNLVDMPAVTLSPTITEVSPKVSSPLAPATPTSGAVVSVPSTSSGFPANPQTFNQAVPQYVDPRNALSQWFPSPVVVYPSPTYPSSQLSGWNFSMMSPVATVSNPNPVENRANPPLTQDLSPILAPSPLPSCSPIPPSSPAPASSPLPPSTPLPASNDLHNQMPDVFQPSGSTAFTQAHDKDLENSEDEDTPTKKRARISLRNAPHGYVEGAMKGTQKYQVARLKPMRQPIQEAHSASKRYKREVDNIVTRCERIAEETGAWIIFGAQLSSAGAAITYSSSKLRKDAIEETTSILQQFQKLTKALTTAKYNDAKELAKQLQDVLAAQEAQRRGEQVRSLEAQKKLLDQQAELAAKDVLIARYRLQLGE